MRHERRNNSLIWNRRVRACLSLMWRFLVRMDVAAVLIAIVLLIVALGSCFPSVRWFHSPVFLFPLIVFMIATLACALDRWRRVWRRALTRPGGRLAALASLLNHIAVPLLLMGVAVSAVAGWRAQLTVEPGATVELGRGSRLALRNERFTIERYSDGSVASYNAEVTLVKEDGTAERASVQVNKPLSYGGVGVYLQGYQEVENGYSLTFLAVRDPGYGLVVAAGFLLLLGLAAKLCS